MYEYAFRVQSEPVASCFIVAPICEEELCVRWGVHVLDVYVLGCLDLGV